MLAVAIAGFGLRGLSVLDAFVSKSLSSTDP